MDLNEGGSKFGSGNFGVRATGTSAIASDYHAEVVRETARLFQHENVRFSKSCSPPTATDYSLTDWNMISTLKEHSLVVSKSDHPGRLIAIQTPTSFLRSEALQQSAQEPESGEVPPFDHHLDSLRMKFSLVLSRLEAEKVGLNIDVETSKYFKMRKCEISGLLRPEVVEYRLHLAKYAFKYSMFCPRNENWLAGLVTSADGKEIRSLNCRLRLLQVDGLLTDVFRTRKEVSFRAGLLRGKLKSLKTAYKLRNPSQFNINRNIWASVWNNYLNFGESQRRERWKVICDDVQSILNDLHCVNQLIELPTGHQEKIAELNNLPDVQTCSAIHKKYAREVIMLASSFQQRSRVYLHDKIYVGTVEANNLNRAIPGRSESIGDEMPAGNFGMRFDRFCTSLKKSFTSLFG